MKTEQRSEIRGVLRFVSAVLCLALAASCATQPEGSPREIAAAKILREARSTTIPTETRAADYLQAASLTAPEPGIEQQGTLGRETYNAAAAELTVLLRSADGGRLWDRPLTLAGHNVRYHLRLHAATPLIWSPQYFTSFTPSAKIREKLIKEENHQQGIGGSLVGVGKLAPGENFVVPRGLSAGVTARIDFKGEEATLALR